MSLLQETSWYVCMHIDFYIKNTTNVCLEANESSMQNHRMRSLYSNKLKAH